MTEQTGWTEPEPVTPVVPPVDVGSPAAPPPAPDPSQEPPADAPAPESDPAPDAAGEPAPEPEPAPEAAPEQPAPYVPDGQPSWLADLVTHFDGRIREIERQIAQLLGG